MSFLQDAYDYFLGQGYSPNASAGIATGLYAESGGNPSITNPVTGAYGIAQDLGTRQANLFSQFGSSPSVSDQLSFVNQELPTNGYNAIENASSPIDALTAFITQFERPAAGSETTSDIARGTAALSQINMGGGTGIGATSTSNSGFVSAVESDLTNASDYVAGLGTSLLGGNTTPTAAQGPNNAGATAGAATGAGVASSVGQAVQSAADNVLAPIEKSIGTFITGFEGGIENAFARGGFGIVGIILLFAGIFFLAASTNTGKAVGRTVAAAAA